MKESVAYVGEINASYPRRQASEGEGSARDRPARRKWTRRAALVAPLVLASCASDVVESPPPTRRALDAVRADPAKAIAWLNTYRAEAGLSAVSLDADRANLSQSQANAMAAADRMSHDVAGAFSARLGAAGVRVGEAGENVCAGYFSTEDAMAAWRASPGHDANLRLASATRFGIAVAKNPRSRFGAFWAMAIASPPPRI